MITLVGEGRSNQIALDMILEKVVPNKNLWILTSFFLRLVMIQTLARAQTSITGRLKIQVAQHIQVMATVADQLNLHQ